MEFSSLLNKYIKEIKCTSKTLADTSTLSETVISRYRNGKRIPLKDSKQIILLARGLIIIANNKKINLNEQEIINSFNSSLTNNNIKYDIFRNNFNELINGLKINMIDMAHFLNFDASYLSRIRNGKRIPSDIKSFSESVCLFITSRYKNNNDKSIISNIINCSLNDIDIETKYIEKLSNWMCYNENKNINYLSNFLSKLDNFNLNDYIRLIHFDDIKVPSFPIHFPTSKIYYGLDNMKKGEIDFFKTTILSKNNEDIFMCSDMPMEDMAKDVDFGKKWMYAIAVSLKKGLILRMVHNVNRPFKEMMLGLESWIPLYMTGQIISYYLTENNNTIFNHLLYTSGTAILNGECINNHHLKGKYYLTTNKEEVNYYKERAKHILNKAKPLMQIYRENSKDYYQSFILENSTIVGNRYGILSSPPLFTITPSLLKEILSENFLDEEEINKAILNFKEEQKIIKNILKHSCIYDKLLELSEEEFNNTPLTICLNSFNSKKIYYTYNQYKKHLNLTKQYSNKHQNYTINLNNDNAFKNIQIYIHHHKHVIISKNMNPSIIFVIKHPKLCEAIEKFVAPVVDIF